MGLIRCPECGMEISDKAYECPQCGKRLKLFDKRNFLKIACGVIVLIVLLGTCIYISSDYRKYNSAKEYYEKENYSEAAKRFKKLEDYKDSKELYLKAEHQDAVMKDKVPPVISMDSKSIVLKQGEGFNVSEWVKDNNVTAYDDVSDTLVLDIDTSELQFTKAGEYKVTVNAEDEAGNKQSEEVAVTIKRVYTREELEKAVKSTYNVDIPGLDRIEYSELTVWIYLVHDGMAESGMAAKLDANVKNEWNELMKELDNVSKKVYSHLLSEGYSDIKSVNVVLLNDLNKSKMLYFTVNGTKSMDATD